MSYLAIKWAHIGLATMSLALFILRWYWMARGSSRVQLRVVRTLPHVLDTLFLASGVCLAWLLGANPWQTPWLFAKLLGVIVYIALAWIAYRPSLRFPVRCAWFATALAVFAWVISVARLRDPAGFISVLF